MLLLTGGRKPMSTADNLLAEALILVEAGADLAFEDERGQSALYLAAERGHMATSTMELLLDRGAAVDQPTWMGWTPLHAASRRGNEAGVRLLLERGADPKAQADHDQGRAPLTIAVGEGHAACARVLLEHGASWEQVGGCNRTAAEYALQYGHPECLWLLYEHAPEEELQKGMDYVRREMGAQAHGAGGRLEMLELIGKLRAEARALGTIAGGPETPRLRM